MYGNLRKPSFGIGKRRLQGWKRRGKEGMRKSHGEVIIYADSMGPAMHWTYCLLVQAIECVLGAKLVIL